MDNYITNAQGDVIGYYSDLTKFNKKQMTKAVELNDWESLGVFVEIQQEVDNWTDADGLLVVSENNGMGWTVKQYKDYKEI